VESQAESVFVDNFAYHIYKSDRREFLRRTIKMRGHFFRNRGLIFFEVVKEELKWTKASVGTVFTGKPTKKLSQENVTGMLQGQQHCSRTNIE
jgi:hypothetical protein